MSLWDLTKPIATIPIRRHECREGVLYFVDANGKCYSAFVGASLELTVRVEDIEDKFPWEWI